MSNINKELHDLFAEARGIRIALEHEAISYEEAQQRVKPLLKKINAAGVKIAKKYGLPYKEITLQSLENKL